MALPPKPQPHDFRDIKRVLPEEHKTRLEVQIRVAQEVRRKISRALEKEKDAIPDSSLRRLTSSGEGGHALADKLRALTLQRGVSQDQTLVSRVEQLIEEYIREWRAEWERLGGSTRESNRVVLEEMDLTDYWYPGAFDRHERNLVFGSKLFESLPDAPSRVRCLDLGCGRGRASLLALEALKNRHGEEKARLIARNLRAVDLIPKNVAATQEALQLWGVKESNVIQGDFFEDFPPELQRGDIHFMWAPMHTLWYGVTERDLKRLLRNIERALAPGGLIMFDTVRLFNLGGIPQQRTIFKNDDLADFYAVLVRRERERIFGIAHPEGKVIARHPIIDVAPGSGPIHREILTQEYMDYLLKEIRSSLRFNEAFSLDNFQFGATLDRVKKREQAEALGMQWIRINGLEEDLRREIAFREKQKRERKSFVIPLYSLRQDERAGQVSPEDLQRAMVEEKLRAIARRMVFGYEQRYLFYEKSPMSQKKKKRKKKVDISFVKH